MFGDFLTLCFDQIVNHIAKYEAMYNGQATCPVIIRTPSGGGRGYGPTHSQSLEKHFLGVPHLRVVAASLFHDPARPSATLLAQTTPVLLHRAQAALPAAPEAAERRRGSVTPSRRSACRARHPTVAIRPVGAPRTAR